jgi:hypothetical protein
MKLQTLLSVTCSFALSFSVFSQEKIKSQSPETQLLNPSVRELRSCGLVRETAEETNVQELKEVVMACRGSRVIACSMGRSISMIDSPAAEAKAPFALQVYPNPTVSSFEVKTNGEVEIKSVTVLDMTGKCVFENPSYMQERSPVDVSGLKTGVYLVRVHAGGKFYTEQLIVNR